MRVRDEALWQQQRAELQSDEVGQAFLGFIEDWVTTAEDAVRLNPALSPATAIRAALDPVEQRQGRIAASYVGQMLIVIITHWTSGESVAEELTVVEQRLMEDMLVLKLAELERAAAETDDMPEEVLSEE